MSETLKLWTVTVPRGTPVRTAFRNGERVILDVLAQDVRVEVEVEAAVCVHRTLRNRSHRSADGACRCRALDPVLTVCPDELL